MSKIQVIATTLVIALVNIIGSFATGQILSNVIYSFIGKLVYSDWRYFGSSQTLALASILGIILLIVISIFNSNYLQDIVRKRLKESEEVFSVRYAALSSNRDEWKQKYMKLVANTSKGQIPRKVYILGQEIIKSKFPKIYAWARANPQWAEDTLTSMMAKQKINLGTCLFNLENDLT